MWQLTVEICPDGGQVGRVIPVPTGPTVVGRAGCRCDVPIPDPRISSRHFEFFGSDTGVHCRDLGSTHGLLVNGVRAVEPKVLTEGDGIGAGSTRFVVGMASGSSDLNTEGGDVERDHQENVREMQSRYYREDVQEFKGMVNDEILARLKLSGGVASKNIKDEGFRDNVVAMLDKVLDERWYQAPIDLDRGPLRQMLMDDLLAYGPITGYLNDERVSEVMVNGPKSVFVEMGGRLQETDCRFLNDAHVMVVIQRIVEPLGRRIDESSPRVDARLPDGSRVNAVIPPITLDGPSLTIRKFSKERLTGEDLVRFGSLTAEMLSFLSSVVRSRQNVIVSGGTGSGKTTLLNVLSHYIPLNERIVTIEDSAELQLKHRNLVRMEARPPNIEGKGEVSIRDLVINSLRMRPDRIVVGECRGKEAFDMLQAMNTGHDGSLTTIHANTPRDALLRMENMVMMAGFELPIIAIREHIASAVNIVVQQTRLADGSRKITRISEVTGREEDVITMQDIFRFVQTGMSKEGSGKVEGYFEPTGNIPSFLETLRKRGVLDLDLSVFSTGSMEGK